MVTVMSCGELVNLVCWMELLCVSGSLGEFPYLSEKR